MDTRKRLILTVVLMSYLVTAMNAAVIVTGLERMARELGLGQTALAWVQNAYVLAWGGFMLIGGKLSDTFGRKHILCLSLVLFGAGSLAAGVAESAGVLISARFVQGMGASVLAPTSLALIIDCFEGQERVKAVAWYGSISGLGTSVGLVVGGVLAGFFSWRYGFYAYMPLLVFMLVVAVKVLPNGKNKGNKRFDITGTVLSVVGVFALVYAIDGAKVPWLWLSLAVVLIAAFVLVERKTAEPIMPLRLFNLTRSRANFARVLFSGSMMGVYFFISEYLQEVFRITPLWVGIAFLPLTLSTFWAAIRVPGAVARWGNMRVLCFGQVLMLIGFALMLRLDEHSSYAVGIALPLLLLGVGQGFAMSPLTNLGIIGVASDDAGAASGVVNAAHQIGCSVGLSLMVAAGGGIEGIAAKTHVAMQVGFLLTVVAFITMFFRNKYINIVMKWKQ